MSGIPFDHPLVPYPSAHPAVLATPAILMEGIVGISAQFREDAATYDARYFDVDSKVTALLRALELGQVKLENTELNIFDVGSGSGNTTFALNQLFPKARIYASDLSPELLTILAARAENLGILSQIVPFVADASQVAPKAGFFDVIVGSSMLHHLLDPAPFMERCIGALSPGGIAIFFEPFQAGHVIIRLLMAAIVQLGKQGRGISDEKIDFFERYIFTIDTMMREDRNDAVFSQLDDKWMFTRQSFARVAQRCGVRMAIFSTSAARGHFVGRSRACSFRASATPSRCQNGLQSS